MRTVDLSLRSLSLLDGVRLLARQTTLLSAALHAGAMRRNDQGVTMTTRHWYLGVLAIIVTTGCGGSKTPTAPQTPAVAQVQGSWSGTFESQNFQPRALFMDLTQIGDTINGTWATSPSEWNGLVGGTVDATRYSGIASFSAPRAGGGTCTGSASFSGTASANTMNWTSPGIVSGTCDGMPIGLRLVLQRR